MMYWMALSKDKHMLYTDSIAAAEKEKLALKNRTVDFVAPGEQQTEVDHSVIKNNSSSGNSKNAFYRKAAPNGSFSYVLPTKKMQGLTLMIRLSGRENNRKSFDIFIGDKKFVTVHPNQMYQLGFYNLSFPVSREFLEGKIILP